MVVAAGRDEGRLVAVAVLELEAHDAAPEVQRPVEVGDLQVDVADVDAGIDRHLGSSVACPSRAPQPAQTTYPSHGTPYAWVWTASASTVASAAAGRARPRRASSTRSARLQATNSA